MQFVANEKEALKRAMTFIESQMERLQKDYMNLLERSRELDQIEGLSSPVNQPEPTPVEDKLELSLEEAIAEHTAKFSEEAVELPTEDTKKKVLAGYSPNISAQYKSEIEHLKDREFKNRVVKNHPKKSKYRDIGLLAGEAKVILKESGRPLKAKELIAKLAERDIDMTKSPHQTIYNIQKHDPKIEKVSFGYYQYRG